MQYRKKIVAVFIVLLLFLLPQVSFLSQAYAAYTIKAHGVELTDSNLQLIGSAAGICRTSAGIQGS